MLKEEILDVMFKRRCDECNQFVFLIDYKVHENKLSGTTECMGCLKISRTYFLLNQNEKRSTH